MSPLLWAALGFFLAVTEASIVWLKISRCD
jgi:hypothetical protein